MNFCTRNEILQKCNASSRLSHSHLDLKIETIKENSRLILESQIQTLEFVRDHNKSISIRFGENKILRPLETSVRVAVCPLEYFIKTLHIKIIQKSTLIFPSKLSFPFSTL